MWLRKYIQLPPRRRGFHLITPQVVEALPELTQVRIGWLHLFLLHTSASLTINENADPDVPADLETAMHALVPESLPYAHTIEGPDDMPAHVKCSLLGCSLLIPVEQGRLVLGTWQGIYLCEHRQHASARRLVLTLQGESAATSP
ncbi:MAG: hypothetical protein KatS3mg113_0751 [Planctomycetaceae bacterium]|nr:MAG: hypothetical protein KatS3mg113_0751 [Planctomycetaceae bacterium]